MSVSVSLPSNGEGGSSRSSPVMFKNISAGSEHDRVVASACRQVLEAGLTVAVAPAVAPHHGDHVVASATGNRAGAVTIQQRVIAVAARHGVKVTIAAVQHGVAGVRRRDSLRGARAARAEVDEQCAIHNVATHRELQEAYTQPSDSAAAIAG